MGYKLQIKGFECRDGETNQQVYQRTIQDCESFEHGKKIFNTIDKTEYLDIPMDIKGVYSVVFETIFIDADGILNDFMEHEWLTLGEDGHWF